MRPARTDFLGHHIDTRPAVYPPESEAALPRTARVVYKAANECVVTSHRILRSPILDSEVAVSFPKLAGQAIG